MRKAFVALLLCSAVLSACSDDTSDAARSAASNVAHKAKPVSQAEIKRQYIASANESISGAMIAGNPFKYVGQRVDLHCTVESIPMAEAFNLRVYEPDPTRARGPKDGKRKALGFIALPVQLSEQRWTQIASSLDLLLV